MSFLRFETKSVVSPVTDADLDHGVSAGSVEWETGQGLLVQHSEAGAQKWVHDNALPITVHVPMLSDWGSDTDPLIKQTVQQRISEQQAQFDDMLEDEEQNENSGGGARGIGTESSETNKPTEDSEGSNNEETNEENNTSDEKGKDKNVGSEDSGGESKSSEFEDNRETRSSNENQENPAEGTAVI